MTAALRNPILLVGLDPDPLHVIGIGHRAVLVLVALLDGIDDIHAVQHLSEDGILMVYVPFQQYLALSPKSALLNYHIQLFSVRSLAVSLRKSGFQDIKANLYNLSYRGNKSFNILAVARQKGREARMPFLTDYPGSVSDYITVLARTAFRKIGEYRALKRKKPAF